MVTRQLEPEIEDIFALIEEEKNFLLSGGAGSGKTYSLVQFIKEIIERNPTIKIACMTYTNSAVKEIEERVNHSNLQVGTIHEFLWNTVKQFQKELKESLIELINDDSVDKISSPHGGVVEVTYYDELNKDIEYLGFTNIKEGIVSHDAVIVLVNYMFAKYPKLSDILKDRFKYILIDEYQDTHEKVVEIFLTHLKQSNRKNIIGFFGDAMQSIYDNGIGDLNEYLERGDVFEIQKRQNRRNPKAVIELVNRLRIDGLEQQSSTDDSAPNMENGEIKEGNVKFYYSTEKLENLDAVKGELDWEFENAKETKELNLTHNLIATKAGFRELMDIYNNDPILKLKDNILQRIKDNKKYNKSEIIFNQEDSFDIVLNAFQLKNRQRELKKDLILADEKTANLFNQLKDFPFSFIQKFKFSKNNLIDKDKFDPLIKILFTIQHNVKLYQNKKYNEFLRQTKYRVTTIKEKQDLKNIIDKLKTMSEKSIEEVISYAGKKKLCNIEDDKYKNFIDEKAYIYKQVKNLKYRVFQALYDYVEGYTPFSTQHKVKGAEFNNVLVVLDNGNWNDYNFKNLFLENGSASVLNRTQKIFYVCCTRAKENLVVFYDSPSDEVVEKAKEWFGEGNIKLVG